MRSMRNKEFINMLYLVLECEKRCYEMDEVLNNLYYQKNQLENNHEYRNSFFQALPIQPEKPKSDLYYSTPTIKGYLGLSLVVFIILLIVTSLGLSDMEYLSLSKSIPFVVILSFIVSFGIFFYMNLNGKKEYDKAMKAYQTNMASYNATLQQVNAYNTAQDEKLKRYYDYVVNESDNIQKQLDETYSIVVNLYDRLDIYEKYREISYVASMIEYLESGICNDLKGANGVYARLEDDIKHKRIEDKLDIIITKLDAIYDTQYLLYNSLQECNQTISNLNNNINNKANMIISNQINNYQKLESVEYTNRVIQSNTEALARMKAYELMLRR